jgi:hypothetical protein
MPGAIGPLDSSSQLTAIGGSRRLGQGPKLRQRTFAGRIGVYKPVLRCCELFRQTIPLGLSGRHLSRGAGEFEQKLCGRASVHLQSTGDGERAYLLAEGGNIILHRRDPLLQAENLVQIAAQLFEEIDLGADCGVRLVCAQSRRGDGGRPKAFPFGEATPGD